jgi:23S rRNA (adenine2503-C2)-methyltransferase
MKCSFCASGKKFVRDLTPEEIVGQIDVPVDSVVFMGMGEPLDNPRIVEAIELIKKEKNIASRKITVSTCGIIDKIETLLSTKVNFAFSLNATTEEQRSKVMPINKKYSLKELSSAMNALAKKLPLSRRIEIEYVLIDGFNDSIEDARRLGSLIPKNSLINLIPINEVDGFTAPGKKKIADFKSELRRQGFICFVRESKGKDVKAACGMLNITTIK